MGLMKELRYCRGRLRLSGGSAAATPGIKNREEAEQSMEALVDRIREGQMRLFVNGTRALLVIIQGMDTAGKDGTIRQVFGRVNPAGCRVVNFKQPTPEEKRHDFLWRAHMAVPPHGIIGIFNRSYYEDTLVVRVHADALLPPDLKKSKDIWGWRFELINTFEKMLVRDNIHILKFFLHLSRDEQLERLRDRQKKPVKQWKLTWDDIRERRYWDDYIHAYCECLKHTSTPHAPWYIIPSDRKWYRNYAVASIVEQTLSKMHLPPPAVSDPGLLKVRIT